MLSIRFSRKGKKKSPLYSLIVLEKSKDPWGDYIEKLGTFNPHTKTVDFKADRITYWIGIGAQPTATVHNLLVTRGIIKADKVRAGKSQPGKKRLAKIAGAKQAEEDAKAPKTEEAPTEAVIKETPEAAAEAPVVEEVVAKVALEVVAETPVEDVPKVVAEALAEEVAVPAETVPEAPAEEAPAEEVNPVK